MTETGTRLFEVDNSVKEALELMREFLNITLLDTELKDLDDVILARQIAEMAARPIAIALAQVRNELTVADIIEKEDVDFRAWLQRCGRDKIEEGLNDWFEFRFKIEPFDIEMLLDFASECAFAAVEGLSLEKNIEKAKNGES